MARPRLPAPQPGEGDPPTRDTDLNADIPGHGKRRWKQSTASAGRLIHAQGMDRCRKCGGSIGPSQNFCTHCGAVGQFHDPDLLYQHRERAQFPESPAASAELVIILLPSGSEPGKPHGWRMVWLLSAIITILVTAVILLVIYLT